MTAVLHRCQLIEYVIGFDPFHLPFVDDSCWPTVGVPVITGGAVACGVPALPSISAVEFEVGHEQVVRTEKPGGLHAAHCGLPATPAEGIPRLAVRLVR